MASISSLGIGSGMDLNGLVDQLESAERQQLTPIVQQQKSYQAQISAFGRLESALDKFQQAAATLNDADSFRSVKSNMSGDAMTATVGTKAVAGTYDIAVTELAQAHSLASSGVSDKTEKLGAGNLSIQVGDEKIDIDISEGKSSLASIRDAINAKEGGVTASIINDGGSEPYRLVLTSKNTGVDSKMTVAASGNPRLEALLIHNESNSTMEQTVAPKNAALTVNGIAITSQSNRVEEAIQGVTLNLDKVTGTGEKERLTVSQDSEAITKNVQDFVDAYNTLQKTMDGLTSYDKKSGVAGQLLGDSTMRGVESRLRNVMGNPLDGDGLKRLFDVGIELKLDGKLEVDSEKLEALVAESPESLSRFFGGNDTQDGFSDILETTVKTMLDEGGLLSNATSGLEKRIEGLGDRYSRTEERIDATVARYRKQFAQMDTLVAQMNSTMSYLGQQFDAMNAQLGRK
ncbi:flagellar filament capping protein FliD [Halomonas sp. GXIMD04776]|uniref:flagellar filament capping protein FliD n=1 Tax=Halomonas sp. GXIMD04776 TaxID=3415605 RepID=UPI003CA2B38E